MSDQFLRFQAVQAGPFDESQNVVDLYLPGDGVYDLADSFLNVYCSMSTTDTTGATGAGVYSTALRVNGTNNHMRNELLVRNCSMSCQARGQIENIRRADVLHTAIKSLSQSQRQDASDAYLNANTLVEAKGNQHYSIFQNIRKTGNTLSAQQETPIQIRLGDVMDACNSRGYDGRRLGQTHFRFELNAPDAAGTGGLIRGYQTIRQTLDEGNPARLFQDVTAVGAVTQLVIDAGAGLTKLTVPSEADYPYYVGQKITVAATQTGGAPALNNGGETQITGIAFDKATSAVTLTVAPSLGTLAGGQSYTAVSCAGIVQPASVSVAFNRVELVAKRLGAPPPISTPMQLVYTTYSTQEDNGVPNATSFQRQYMCEPEADAVLITFPDTAGIYSTNNNLENSRLRLNQIDVTDRDVVVDSPLYYDRLSALVQAMGYQVRNLQQDAGDSSGAAWNYFHAWKEDGGVATAAINAPGTGYVVNGRNIALGGGSGGNAQIRITSVGGAGDITGFVIVDPGRNYVAAETLTVPGGNADATIDVNTIYTKNRLVYAGCRMPQTMSEKALQFNANLAAGGQITNITLFKRLPRLLEA